MIKGPGIHLQMRKYELANDWKSELYARMPVSVVLRIENLIASRSGIRILADGQRLRHSNPGISKIQFMSTSYTLIANRPTRDSLMQ